MHDAQFLRCTTHGYGVWLLHTNTTSDYCVRLLSTATPYDYYVWLLRMAVGTTEDDDDVVDATGTY